MLVTNQTNNDYWFGPLHLASGVGQTLTVDDTSDTSLYLTDDSVADALNNLYISGKITVSGEATPFPRPTGTPEMLHGSGSPEGSVYAPQGSLYLRRDGTGPNSLYSKTTGVTIDTGWNAFNNSGAGVSFRKTTAKAVTNSTADTDLLNAEITIPANQLGLTGAFRLTAWGDWVQSSGASTAAPVLTLKLGGTTLLKTGLGALTCVATSASRFGWRAKAEVINLGASNVQSCSLEVVTAASILASTSGYDAFATGEGASFVTNANGVARNALILSEGWGSGAVDTTVGCALVLSVINPTATATCETKLYAALIEIL